MGKVRELLGALGTVRTGSTLPALVPQDAQPPGSFIRPHEHSSNPEPLRKVNDNEFIPSDNLEVLANQIQQCLRELGDVRVERAETERDRINEMALIERRRQREDNAFQEREDDALRNLGTARDVWKQRFEALFKDFDPETMLPMREQHEATIDATGIEKAAAQQQVAASNVPPTIPPQEQAESASDPVHITKI